MSKEPYSDLRWYMPGVPVVSGFRKITKKEKEHSDKVIQEFAKKIEAMRKANKKREDK